MTSSSSQPITFLREPRLEFKPETFTSGAFTLRIPTNEDVCAYWTKQNRKRYVEAFGSLPPRKACSLCGETNHESHGVGVCTGPWPLVDAPLYEDFSRKPSARTWSSGPPFRHRTVREEELRRRSSLLQSLTPNVERAQEAGKVFVEKLMALTATLSISEKMAIVHGDDEPILKLQPVVVDHMIAEGYSVDVLVFMAAAGFHLNRELWE